MLESMPPNYPPNRDVAALSLALYNAFDASYPRMPAEEQRLLRATMLDQTRPWEAVQTDMPTLRTAISGDVYGIVQDMPGTLADAMFAPAFIWGLTQDWVPNQSSMVETVLNKWSAEHVHNEDLKGPHIEAHIQLMQQMVLLLDQMPFDVDPLVYAKVLRHTNQVHRPYGVDRYNDDTPGVWLQWLARITIRGEAGIFQELCAPAHLVWDSIALFVFTQVSRDIQPQLKHAVVFESILDSTLPAMWRLLTLRHAHTDYWTLPQFAPRLHHVLSRRVGIRIMELPWRGVDNVRMNQKAIESNRVLAQTFLPDLYPALSVMLEADAWANPISLVQVLLACAFSMENTAEPVPVGLDASLDKGLFE